MYDLVKFEGFIGINTDIIPSKLPPPDESLYLRDVNNVIIEDGLAKKIKGYDYFNNITTQLGQDGYRELLGTPIYKKYDDTKYFLAVCPRNIYKLDGDTAWTQIGTVTAGDNDSVFSFVNSDNKFIFTISADGTIISWDGTTYQNLVNPSTLKARYILEFKGSLFLLRVIESGTERYQKLRWSTPYVVDTFPDGNSLTLDSEEKILGGRQMGNEILVYFEKEIYRVYWVDDTIGYGSEPLIQGSGIIAPRTLCGNQDVHFWLAQQGLMKLIRGDYPRSISNGKFDKLILDEIDPEYKHKAVAKFYPHKNMLYLSFPSSGNQYNTTQIIYDNASGEMISKKNLTHDSFSSYGEWEKDLSGLADDERQAYGLAVIPIFGTKDGYVHEQKITSYQDKSQIAESNIRFVPTKLKFPSHHKRVLQCDVIAEKKTDDDITFILEIANEMNDTCDLQINLTGNGDEGIRRYTFTGDANNELDITGKEFNIRLKDYNNQFGWDLHEVILRGYASTVN